MALARGADDHDVVGAVVGRHAHAADVILKAPGGDFRGDDGQGLGVDAAKVVGGRQGYKVLQGFRNILVGEAAHGEARGGLAPGPAAAAGTVGGQVLKDFAHIQRLVLLQAVHCHLIALLQTRL